jgi:type IV pilus assembly protein PilW
MTLSRSSLIRHAHGRSLLELLIAMAVGLVVMGAALAIFSATSSSSRVSESESRLNENATIALGILQQHIRLAGYSSIAGSTTYTIRKNYNDAGVRGCEGGFTSETATFAALTCNNTTATDAISVRYEADLSNSTPVVAGAATLAANCVSQGIAATTASQATSTAAGAAALPNYALADNRFYVKSVGTPSGGPELYCAGATGNGTFGVPQPIMEGVERIELSYGVAASPTANITTAYMSAQSIDTQFAAEADRWKRVVSVKVCLVMRSTENADQTNKVTLSGVTNRYYDCNNTLQTTTDNYLRRAYTSTVLLKNRIPL